MFCFVVEWNQSLPLFFLNPHWVFCRCGPCKVIAPKYKELSEKYQDMVFLKLDCNQENKVCSSFCAECVFIIMSLIS